MKKYCLLFTLLFILSSYNGFSQNLLNPNQEKITKAFTDFFKLDRENIHLQLNKSNYLTNEIIWFKGYVIEKKSQTPFAKTTNVYVSLVDDAGKTIETNLYLAENGTLNGSFKLLEKNR